MATKTLQRGERFASPAIFAAALDLVNAADTRLDQLGYAASAEYRDAVERLIGLPAPDIAGLAAKIAAADPMDLDHHAAILADALRLAGGHE